MFYILPVAKKLIGFDVKYMTALLKIFGFSLRIVKQDGLSCITTCDYKKNRINVAVENNRISNIGGIG